MHEVLEPLADVSVYPASLIASAEFFDERQQMPTCQLATHQYLFRRVLQLDAAELTTARRHINRLVKHCTAHRVFDLRCAVSFLRADSGVKLLLSQVITALTIHADKITRLEVAVTVRAVPQLVYAMDVHQLLSSS